MTVGAVTSGVKAIRLSVALSFPASSVTVTVQSEYVVPSVNVSNVMLVVPLDNEVESDVVQDPPNTNVPDSSVVTSKVGVTLVVYPFESAIWVMLIVGAVVSTVIENVCTSPVKSKDVVSPSVTRVGVTVRTGVNVQECVPSGKSEPFALLNVTVVSVSLTKVVVAVKQGSPSASVPPTVSSAS